MMRRRRADATWVTMKLVRLTVYNENSNRWMSEFMNLQTYSSLLDIRRTAYTTTCNLYFYFFFLFFFRVLSAIIACPDETLTPSVLLVPLSSLPLRNSMSQVDPWVMSLVRACSCVCMYTSLYVCPVWFIRVQIVIILEDIENSLRYVK